MKPSRELDSWVAEKVMGWPATMHPLSRPVPHYSTSIAAAWTVDKSGWLWEFQETLETCTVMLYTSPALRREAIAMYPILPRDVILIRRTWLGDEARDKAQTYAWLRCLAALEAVGVEVEDA